MNFTITQEDVPILLAAKRRILTKRSMELRRLMRIQRPSQRKIRHILALLKQL